MKHSLWLVVLLGSLSIPLFAENQGREEGTIVRMRMDDCLGPQHSLLDSLSGSNHQPSGDLCPEYVLVTGKVVYVIVGKNSDRLVPLAETTRFHFQNKEILIRVDDARRETHFHVKEMMLRQDWDRNQEIEEAEAGAMTAVHRHAQGATLLEAQQ